MAKYHMCGIFSTWIFPNRPTFLISFLYYYSKEYSETEPLGVMNHIPVIFLAFANDPDQHLDMLKAEGQGIYRRLQALHDKDFIELYRDQQADIQSIFDDFARFSDRIAVFHYGGHANSRQLLFEGQKAEASGIAELMATHKEQLKLVFLNGCSTKKQVEKLHQLDIPAVIATSVRIGDKAAKEFALHFYQAFGNRSSLEKAFKHACAHLESINSASGDPTIVRDFGWVKDETEEISWGLYLNPDLTEEEEKELLGWKLPQYQPISPPKATPQSYEVNQGMFSLLGAMAEYDEELRPFVNNRRRAPISIVENFPWTIGAQLRKLFANTEQMNRPGKARLLQLIETYIVSTQFLAYTALSQYWDEIRQLDLPSSEPLLEIDEWNYSTFDYLVLLRQSIQRLRNILPDKPLFIGDMEESLKRLEPGGESYEAYRFLEATRMRLQENEIEEAEAARLCLDCEATLTELLIRAAFLARYRLLTIKDIRIFNLRHTNPFFDHRLGELNVPHKDYLWEDNVQISEYAESQSVVLKPKTQEVLNKNFQSLSPFIIDKSAFLAGQVPAIYLFAFQKGKEYHYISVDRDVNNQVANESDWLVIGPDNQDFAIIYQQFREFQRDVGGIEESS